MLPIKIWICINSFWQTRTDAQCPPTNPVVGQFFFPSERSRPLPQIRLHLLPIQKHIIPPHNSRWCQVIATNFFELFCPDFPWKFVDWCYIIAIFTRGAVTLLLHMLRVAVIILLQYSLWSTSWSKINSHACFKFKILCTSAADTPLTIPFSIISSVCRKDVATPSKIQVWVTNDLIHIIFYLTVFVFQTGKFSLQFPSIG